MSEVSLNEDICEDILESEEDVKSEANIHYPNEAYADLMLLVTKYKLSNVIGNAIIKFFNKHANLNSSSLPKSIEEGCNKVCMFVKKFYYCVSYHITKFIFC